MGQFSGVLPGSLVVLPAISPHLRSKIAIVMKSRDYISARQAILDCIKKTSGRMALTGIDETDPDPEMLTTLACAVIISATPRRKVEREGMAAAVGKSWKQLEDMPRRIEKIAIEIEGINTDGLLAPARQVNREAQNAEDTLKRLRELPESMRLWAKALGQRAKAVRQDYDAVFAPGKTPLYWLQLFVKRAIGKPRDREVAELLNAAAVALGKDPTFDAFDLAQARSRRKNKI